MSMTLMYNGVQFAPVSTKKSIVVPYQADVLWSVVGKFGRQALWMGSVEGQRIFTQLLGGETADYIGAVRAFGIADKVLFEQLTKLNNQEMIMAWQLMTHPMNSNPWPAAFVNFKASIQLFPILIPGGSTFLEWRMELLTEQHAAAHMTAAMNDIMVVGLTNLTKYMDKSVNNSGGSSAGSQTTSSGIVGSATAPSAYGIPFMPQPNTVPEPSPTIAQALGPQAQLTGNSTFMQQPTYVPAPGQNVAPLPMNSGQNMFPNAVHPPQIQQPMYNSPFHQQQYAKYQQNPALYQQQLQIMQQQQQMQQMPHLHAQPQHQLDPRHLGHIHSFGSGSGRGSQHFPNSPTSAQGQDFGGMALSGRASGQSDANTSSMPQAPAEAAEILRQQVREQQQQPQQQDSGVAANASPPTP